jgi:hypothetical protein
MEHTCAICRKSIDGDAAGIIRGVFYETARLVWTPELSALDARDVDWQYLHRTCVHAVHEQRSTTTRPYRGE